MHDPGLLGLNLNQGVQKREFNLISAGFGELDLLLGKDGTTNFIQARIHHIFILL